MQIIQSKGNPARHSLRHQALAGGIVEKVIRDKDGKLIRARFFVFESNGRIKARLIDFVYLTEQSVIGCANFLLSVAIKAKQILVENYIGNSYVSPYVVLNNFYFSGSKPRAPTFI